MSPKDTQFKNSANNSRIYPGGDNSDMNCCGLFSTVTDVDTAEAETGAISREETQEKLSLVTGKPVKKIFDEPKSTSTYEVEGPLANATAEGIRLSNLRRERIMKTKPVDGIVQSISTNMYGESPQHCV